MDGWTIRSSSSRGHSGGIGMMIMTLTNRLTLQQINEEEVDREGKSQVPNCPNFISMRLI